VGLQTSIVRIGQKCDQLRGLGPALQARSPRPHRYQLGEPVSKLAISQFEWKFGVQLPEEYALFLTEVGNGGAGPGAGLREVNHTIIDKQGVRLPFPYLAYQVHTFPSDSRRWTSHGCILLSTAPSK
jgi:hypothetical protein